MIGIYSKAGHSGMEHQMLVPNHASSTEGMSAFKRFTHRRQNLRVLVYATLLLCDIVAIRVGFELGELAGATRWQGLLGIDLSWLILPIHAVIGLSIGAFSYLAVQSRLESIYRACYSFMLVSALSCMIIFFEGASEEVSRLGFGVSLFASAALMSLLRVSFATLVIGRSQSWMFGELLVVDGGSIPSHYQGDVLDAHLAGLLPDRRDPAQLCRLAEEMAPYDRVIVSCDSREKRSEWAHMLKCYQVKGEVLLDESSPLGAIGVGRFAGEDTIIVSRGALSLGNRFRKRAMDVVISISALFVLAPLMLFVALAIKLDSRGSVFFAQPRVGRDNRMFSILKFRSMRTETCDLAGDRSTTRDDDRITRVGRFIRATSIDELPQFINVLKGDMSIIGPRPHALGSRAGNETFWDIDCGYWQRHALKPGITGLAQIRGFRGATHHRSDLENRLQSDLEYITGWTLWGDVKILIATARVVVHPHAY